MPRPFRGSVFFNKISWLIQVDQEERHGLGEALEMGQNRVVQNIALTCGKK